MFACSRFGTKAGSLLGNHQQLLTIATMDPVQATQAYSKLNKAQARTRKAMKLVKASEYLLKKAKMRVQMAKKVLKMALEAEVAAFPFADDEGVEDGVGS